MAQHSEQSEPPIFSIIIPTCNRSEALKACLEHTLRALERLPIGSCELIVTNDGDAAEGLPASDSFSMVSGPKRGPAANRNHGASRATGKWLVFIDDDCLPGEDIFSAYKGALEDGTFVYEGRTTCDAGIRSPLEQSPINLHGGLLWACNFAISREVFSAIGGFDENFPYAATEDVDLRERLKGAGYRIRFVPEAVVDHPARKVGGLEELRRLHVSIIYHTTVKLRARISLRRILYLTLRTRLRSIITAQHRKDSFKALVLLVQEVVMIATRAKHWERKFQRGGGI